MPKLTVTLAAVATIHAYGHAMPLRTVLVDAIGPRGGKQEFTVTFTRRNTIQCGLRVEPDHHYYQPADIPPEIAAAALCAYAEVWR